MDKNLFISHSTYDKDVIDILANLIRQVSLNQIHIWFSNDKQTNGGFLAGDNWFSSILNNLENSQAVISFITPNSNNQPWILYESGYAEALSNSRLIPLKFLIETNEISTPLKQKQIFDFSNIEDAITFLKKLLNVFEIHFAEEVFHDFIVKALNQMKRVYKSNNENPKHEETSIQLLSKKIDNYFNIILQSEFIANQKREYEISIEYINQIGKTVIEYIRIDTLMTISNVLDKIYYILEETITPYRYLETWILKEKGSDRLVVISDIQDIVPAHYVFKFASQWEVIYLDKPYHPNNSFNAKNNVARMEDFIEICDTIHKT